MEYHDYDPFGMLVNQRTRSESGGYRYGFNGMERDDELKGEGNSLDFGERTYDPRIGRFITIDAYAKVMASHSPYSYALNNPIYFGDEDGNWPKPSELLPKDTSPLIKGIVDGVWEGITGTAGFVYDYATDPQFREQVNESFKALVNDPMGTPGGILEEYAGKIKRLATGNATDADIYDLGTEIGETGTGIILGGATLGTKIAKKVQKPNIDAGVVAEKAKKDAKKVRKKQDPNKPNGFYDIKDGDDVTIYVGKGPSSRASASLKLKNGNKVISYDITEGVAGLTVRETAFAFEELLIQKAKDAGADLVNEINSPGAKILNNMQKSNPAGYKKVKEAFEKRLAQGGKEIKNKNKKP